MKRNSHAVGLALKSIARRLAQEIDFEEIVSLNRLHIFLSPAFFSKSSQTGNFKDFLRIIEEGTIMSYKVDYSLGFFQLKRSRGVRCTPMYNILLSAN